MNYIALSRISLKHLTTLHVLLTTHSVTGAAEKLCVTPSSISKTLKQLREVLNDELFYRDGSHLVPTPYAISIGPTIHSILASMSGILHQGDFEPSEFKGNYRLSMRESTFEVIAPILNQIFAMAPDANFNIYAKEQLGFESLLSGEIDVLLLPHDISQPTSAQKELDWTTLLDDEMICLMGPDHPSADLPMTIDAYLDSEHVGIHDKELTVPYFEQNLTQRYGGRKTRISVADFGAAAVLCHHHPLLFTCSKRWALQAKQAQGLLMKPLPFDYGHVGYSLVCTRQSLNDPAIAWLKQTLSSLADHTG